MTTTDIDAAGLLARVEQLETRLAAAVDRHGPRPGGLLGRALQQATREVLLGQSSDWPFILTMGTQMGYATRRPVVHLSRAHRLLAQLERGHLNESDLLQLEERDCVFPDVDPGHFQP